MKTKLKIDTDYLESVMTPRKLKAKIETVIKVIRHIEKKWGVEVESIACRGVSGLLVASPVSMLMNKGLTIIRKPLPAESTHSPYEVEGCIPRHNYVIIDDFIATGDTVNVIIDKVKERTRKLKTGGPRLLGVIEYKTLHLFYHELCEMDARRHIHSCSVGILKDQIYFADEKVLALQGIE